jgi:hypothetical protein
LIAAPLEFKRRKAKMRAESKLMKKEQFDANIKEKIIAQLTRVLRLTAKLAV